MNEKTEWEKSLVFINYSETLFKNFSPKIITSGAHCVDSLGDLMHIYFHNNITFGAKHFT